MLLERACLARRATSAQNFVTQRRFVRGQFGEFLLVTQCGQISVALPVLHRVVERDGHDRVFLQQLGPRRQVRLEPVERLLAQASLLLGFEPIRADALADRGHAAAQAAV